MPVEVTWYLENRVLLTRFYDDLTLEDIANASNLIDSASQVEEVAYFHNILEVSTLGKYPISLQAIRAASRADQQNNKVQWVIIVGSQNRIIHFLLTTLSQVFNFRFRMFATLEQGLTFLNTVDETLPHLEIKNL